MSNSAEEWSLQVALQSRERSIGARIRRSCLLISLIMASFGSVPSCSQEMLPQKGDLSSDPELQKGIVLAQQPFQHLAGVRDRSGGSADAL